MMNIQTFYGKDRQFDLASNILKLVHYCLPKTPININLKTNTIFLSNLKDPNMYFAYKKSLLCLAPHILLGLKSSEMSNIIFCRVKNDY